MAESTEHKKEQTPLTEEEVEALAEKFTASWEAADDSAHVEADSADPILTGDVGSPALDQGRVPQDFKRTMLGMAPGSAAIPYPVEPAAPFTTDTADPSEQAQASEDAESAEGAIPRQRTLLGIQAPDPSLVKKLAESFQTPTAGFMAGPAPTANALAEELMVDAPAFPEPLAAPAPMENEPVRPSAPTLAQPAYLVPNPVALGPQVAPLPEMAGSAPAPQAPSQAFEAVPEPAPAIDAPASHGPGLFGWGGPVAPDPAVPDVLAAPAIEPHLPPSSPAVLPGPFAPAIDTPLPAPAPVASDSIDVEVDDTQAAPVAPQPVPLTALGPAIAAEPFPTAVAPSQGQAPAPAAPMPVAVAPVPIAAPVEVSSPAPPTGESAQHYAPPAAPPPSSDTRPHEKSVVVEGTPRGAVAPAVASEDAVAVQVSRSAETIPPARPRTEDLELPLGFPVRSNKKTGLLIGAGLAVLVGVGVVIAMSGGDKTATTPSATMEVSAAVAPPKAEKEPTDVAPDNAANPATDAAQPEGSTAAEQDAANEGDAAEEAEEEAAAKPGTLAQTPPKAAPVAKKLPTPPRKTIKVKKPKAKAKSKAIVRDAPF